MRGERIPGPESCNLVADILGGDLDIVLALARHRPLDKEVVSEGYETRLIGLIRAIN